MIRLAGGILIVLCGWLAGEFMGQSQKDRLSKLELLAAYLDAVYCELQYSAAPLDEISSRLARRPCFADFEFSMCCAHKATEFPYYIAFEAAIDNNRKLFGREVCSCLKILAGQLGTVSLEAQLSGLAICKRSIEQMIEHKRPQVTQNAKLSRNLGVFGGVTALILFW